eukprot:jgi/Chlat1/3022/Chrsp201S00232
MAHVAAAGCCLWGPGGAVRLINDGKRPRAGGRSVWRRKVLQCRLRKSLCVSASASAEGKVSAASAAQTLVSKSAGPAGPLTAVAIGAATAVATSCIGLLQPFVLSATAAAFAGYACVPVLHRLKAGQVIRDDGPQAHLIKTGTPTMGGLYFIPVGVALAAVWTKFDPAALAVGAVTLAFGAVGFADDWLKLTRKSHAGISPKAKLISQTFVGACFLAWLSTQQLSLPWPRTSIPLLPSILLPLGLLFYPFALFSMCAMSNGVNLTDGLDGLAAGTAAACFAGLAAGSITLAPSVAVFCVCMAGACVGFLAHNRHKARVFMGDTGSLALGGALAAAASVTGLFAPLLVASTVFVAETLSVILQVTYYKATKGPDGQGKRLFKMAPLHHHFELAGWRETTVIAGFYAASCAFSLLGAALALRIQTL